MNKRGYYKILEGLVSVDFQNKDLKDEIELLTLLIEKRDKENNILGDVDPVALLHLPMNERNLKAKPG